MRWTAVALAMVLAMTAADAVWAQGVFCTNDDTDIIPGTPVDVPNSEGCFFPQPDPSPYCPDPEIGSPRLETLGGCDPKTSSCTVRAVVPFDVPGSHENVGAWLSARFKLFWFDDYPPGTCSAPGTGCGISQCNLTGSVATDINETFIQVEGVSCSAQPLPPTYSFRVYSCLGGGGCQESSISPEISLGPGAVHQSFCREPPEPCSECGCAPAGPGTASPGGGAPGGAPPPAGEQNGPGAMLRHTAGGVGHPGFPGSPDWNDDLGIYWSHDYAQRIELDPTTGNDSHVWLITKEGAFVEFENLVGGVYATVRPSDSYVTLSRLSAGMGWDLQDLDGTVHHFGESGRWESSTDRNNNVTQGNYDDVSDMERITSVDFPDGRSESFTYYPGTGKLETITEHPVSGSSDPDRVWTYEWGGDSLGRVIRPDTSIVEYLYEDRRFPFYVSHVVVRDAGLLEERIVLGRSFDDYGNTSGSWKGGMAPGDADSYDQYSMTWDDPKSPTSATMTDPLGKTTDFTVGRDPSSNKQRIDEIDGDCGVCGYADKSTMTYGDASNPMRATTIIDGNTHSTTYTYEAGTGLMLSKTEGAGSGVARTTQWAYDHDINGLDTNLVTTVTRPGTTIGVDRVTTYIRATNGDVTSRIETGAESTFDPVHAPECDSGTAGEFECTTFFTYDVSGSGELATTDPPGYGTADVTTMTWDASRGGLVMTSRTEPIIGTTYFEYDGFNRRTASVDPNGMRVETDYDSLDRVVESRRCKVANPTTDDCTAAVSAVLTTVTARNFYGDAELVTLPEGNVREYGYDVAGRLATVDLQPDATTETERTQYQYDEAGQRTDEVQQEWNGSSFDDRSHTRWTYDGCRLESMTLGFGSASPSVTEYRYDCVGNLTEVYDPNHPFGGGVASAVYAYDEIDRLESVTTPGSITTSYSYDDQDHLISVTDSEGNVTSYEYGDRDLLVEEVSPVAGTTTHAYNDHGELVHTTDARGVIAMRTLDELDRVTAITHTGSLFGGPAWSFEYDQGPNAIGRLSRSTFQNGDPDPIGFTDYGYDEFGRLATDGELGYGYDDNGNREEVTYPGGVTATYTYDFADRQQSLVVDPGSGAGTVVDGTDTEYYPGGPLRGIGLGNGTDENREFDERYFVDRLRVEGTSTLVDWDYTLDAVGNPTSIVDPAVGNRTYGYDPHQYFLTEGDGPWGTRDYTYDTIGNRLSETEDGGTPFDYTYQSNGTGNTAILQTIMQGAGTDATYTYGPSGNLDQLDRVGNSLQLTYNGAGRMIMGFRSNQVRSTFTYDSRGYLRWVDSLQAGMSVGVDEIFMDGFELGSTSCWSEEEPDAGPNQSCVSFRALEATYSNEGVLHSFLEREDESAIGDRHFVFYFAGRPVAQLEFEDGVPSSDFEYLHTDHLGTPMALTSGAGAELWQGGFEPFGWDWDGARAAGVFLRLPGQWEHEAWADGLAGMNPFYNVHRWYESGTGRYGRVDPLLSRGGVATAYDGFSLIQAYGYVEGRPSFLADLVGQESMTPDDVIFCITRPLACRKVIGCRRDAERAAAGMPGQHNGPGDAFRHCYWSCCMAKELGAKTAERAGTGHESFKENPLCEAMMDLSNNAAGRGSGPNGPSRDCRSHCSSVPLRVLDPALAQTCRQPIGCYQDLYPGQNGPVNGGR